MKAETFQGEHNTTILKLLDKDRNEEDSYCDAVLQVKGEKFNVHRCLLGSLSSYFNKIFKCEMKEKYERTVDLTKFSAETIKTILDFFYTSKVTVTEENAFPLLEAADYLLVYELKGICSKFLISTLTVINCLHLCSIGKVFNCELLQSSSEEVVVKKFRKVVKQPKFKELSTNDVEAIVQALDQKTIGSKPVYEGILIWVHHNYGERKKFFADLFAHVKLHLLPTEYLQGVVAQQELVTSSHACKDHLLNETLYAMKHQNRNEPIFESSSSSENEDNGESEKFSIDTLDQTSKTARQEKYVQQLTQTKYPGTIHSDVNEEKEQLVFQVAAFAMKPQNSSTTFPTDHSSDDDSASNPSTENTSEKTEEDEKSFEKHVYDKTGKVVGRKMYDRSFLVHFRYFDICLEKPSYLSDFEDFAGNFLNGPVIKIRKNPRPNEVEDSSTSSHYYSTPSTSATENEQTNGELRRNVKSILHKMTPSNLSASIESLKLIPVNTEARRRTFARVVFETAVGMPSKSASCASVCQAMSSYHCVTSQLGKTISFIRSIASICGGELHKDWEKSLSKYHMKVEKSQTLEHMQKAKEELDAAEAKERRRMLGNIRFMGELFKLGMLSQRLMHNCILTLIKRPFEESLELLCHLLTAIGKDVKSKKAKNHMDQYFTQINEIIQEGKTSDRVKFMFMGLVDLRQNNWVQEAREAQEPKTIDQVHAEANEDKEQLALQVAAAATAPPMNPQTGILDELGPTAH